MNDDFTKNNSGEKGDPELIPCRRPARRPVRNISSAPEKTSAQNSDEIKIEKIPIEVLEKLLFEHANPKIVEDVLRQKKSAEDAEKARIEKARAEAAERAKAEHERAVAAAEQARLAQARATAEQRAKMGQNLSASEQERIEQARIAAEQERMEQARIAAEQAKMEQARIAAEQARMEQARIAAEQARMEQSPDASRQSAEASSAKTTEYYAPEESASQIPQQQQEKQQEKIPPIADTFDWIKSFLFSLTVVIFVFTLIFRGVTVNGDSMLPTLEDRNYLIISDLFYTPKTGDIVVVQSPNYKNASEPLIKRVIATGGQTVKINFNTWEIWVDGKLLIEDYILRDQAATMNCEDLNPDENGEVEIIVEKDCIFVMGDHRNDSLDSRSNSVGQIDEHYIMGRVLIRLTPLKQFGKVD